MTETLPPRKWIIATIAILLLISLENIILAIVQFSVPSISENALLFGLSPSRLIIVAVMLFTGLMFLISGVLLSFRKIYTEFVNFLKLLGQNKVILIGWSMLISALLSFYIYYSLTDPETAPALQARLQPILFAVFLTSSELLILLSIYHRYSFNSSLILALFGCLDAWFEKISEKILRPVLIVLLVITPFVFLYGSAYLISQVTPADFFPVGIDETNQWLEVRTFKEVGFHSGQYSVNELLPVASFVITGTHGPAFNMIYGSVSRLTGWNFYIPVIINMSILSLALISFIWLTKPNSKSLLLILIITITFWPLWIFAQEVKQEALHFALAIVITGLFLANVRRNRVLSFCLFFLIALASQLRSTWSFLFFPYFLLHAPEISLKNLITAGLKASLPILISTVIFYSLLAPFPGDLTYNMVLGEENISHDPNQNILNTFLINLNNFFSPEDYGMSDIFRVQLIFLLTGSIVTVITDYKYQVNLDSPNDVITWKHLFNLLNIGAFLVLSLLAYYKGIRLFAPLFLMHLLVLALSNDKKWIWLIIITNFIVVFSFLNIFRARLDSMNWAGDYYPPQISSLAEISTKHIQYDPEANRWCNTIAVSKYGGHRNQNIRPILFGLPPEFGLSHIHNWELFYSMPLKSKFVLLHPEFLDENYPGLFQQLDLVILAETSTGNLYSNPSSHCK
jgi:hypothetical protein